MAQDSLGPSGRENHNYSTYVHLAESLAGLVLGLRHLWTDMFADSLLVVGCHIVGENKIVEYKTAPGIVAEDTVAESIAAENIAADGVAAGAEGNAAEDIVVGSTAVGILNTRNFERAGPAAAAIAME